MFDDFSLDPSTGRLWCSGDAVPLTPKAFAVLQRLVEDGGQVVSKGDLLRAGWAGTHVSEGVLKVVILEVRRALGDDPASPRFIETVPRRGYRFIARRSRPPRAAAAADELVGRGGVLAQLEERLARARAGERQMVFVSGEAGIGKTTVLDAFRGRAAADPDLLIAYGGCLEHYGAAEAYLPVLEALGRLLRAPGGERAIRVFATHAPTWLAQMPWLEERRKREATRPEPLGITKERMLREMAEAIEALTANAPLVLVVEDLHWSDYSTLDLLAMLARRRETARLLVVGSYRSVDVIVAGHPLRALIRELRMRRQCEDFALAFLRESHVAAYLAQRFGGHAFPADLARAVQRRTDGNPLFMVRVVDELVALRVLEQEDGRWRLRGSVAKVARAVPESLRALVEQQMDRLHPEAQRLLEVASVLGNEFTIGSVAAALDVDPLAIEEGCEALAGQGQFLSAAEVFVRPDGTNVSRYRFNHNLYPHSIATRVPPGRRLRLHRRVGEWLERTYGAQAAAVAGPLAWHFEAAGDAQRAIHYLVVAAENASRRFAYGDAIRALERGRSLVPRLAAKARGAAEIELLQRIGDAHFGRGAMTECVDAYDAAAARAAADGLTSARVEALSGLVRPLCFIDADRAMTAIAQALRLSANLDDPLLHARIELLGAYVRLTFDAWSEADWEIGAAARAVIVRVSEDGPSGFDTVMFAHLLMLRGDYQGALENAEAGIPSESESSSPAVHFLTLSGRTLALLYSGRLGELVHLLRTGREIAERNGNEPWLFVLRQAWLHTVVLDFAGARELCEAAAARGIEGYWRGQAITIGGIAAGYVALAAGRHREALRSFSRVLDPEGGARFFLQWYWRINAQLGLSNAWLASGKVDKARREVDRLLESALSTAEPNLQALAWELAARVAMAGENWREAEEKIEEALAIVQRFAIPTTAWRVHALRADLYRKAGDIRAAEAQRARAEETVRALAGSFAPDDPLRARFLAAVPLREIEGSQSGNKGARRPRTLR